MPLTDARLEEIREINIANDAASQYPEPEWAGDVIAELLAEITRTRPLVDAAREFATVYDTSRELSARHRLCAAARALSSPTPVPFANPTPMSREEYVAARERISPTPRLPDEDPAPPKEKTDGE